MLLKTGKRKLLAWLQLLRVPNLFTVPGDPMAGFFMALMNSHAVDNYSSLSLVTVLAICILLYCTGLLQNDLFDLEEDRKYRPNRPLPSNLINPLTVIAVALLIAVAAIVSAFANGIETGLIALMLLASITIYNRFAKKYFIGPFVMGLCRGLNLLVGASILGLTGIFSTPVLLSSIFLMLYIASVTYIASSETEYYEGKVKKWVPVAILCLWFLSIFFVVRPEIKLPLMFFFFLGAIAISWTFYCSTFLVFSAPPEVVQKTIGCFLRALLLIQAALIVFSGISPIAVLGGLIVIWFLSYQLSKLFYAS